MPTAEDLEEIRTLCRANKMLEGWEVAGKFERLSSWPSGRSRYQASVLLSNLGASRLARALDWRNLRENLADHEIFLRGQYALLPFAGIAKVLAGCEERLKEHREMPTKDRANLLALCAWSYAMFRDFGRAEPLIDEAYKLAPESSWIHVEKAQVLRLGDCYEEALEWARKAVEIRPYYRPAVIAYEEGLVAMGRDEAAEALLLKAHQGSEMGAFPSRLMIYYRERSDHKRGLWALNECERLSPLAERSDQEWLAARRADLHYMAGRVPEAIRYCKEAKKSSYYQKVAARLEEPGTAQRKRKMLEVPFIRQHSMTCAPATLAAISSFWGEEHDHLEIADAICYDGTSWHKEAEWAEGVGYHVCEFRVTGEAAHALIDRGVPFTLTTSGSTGSHLQACIGYDDRLGVLLLRDPTHRYFGEILLEGMIEDHPVEGPRGMVVVPTDKKHLLEGLSLPDEHLYRANSDLARALDRHDRFRALEALSTMRAIDEGHPFTQLGERQLATYDRDALKLINVLEGQVVRFPENQPLKYRLLTNLGRLGRRERKLELLTALLGEKAVDPVFFSEMGELLTDDARQFEMAEYYLLKVVRLRPTEGRTHSSLGWCYWKQRRFKEAGECQRIASCLSRSFEPYAMSYFETCLLLGEREEGLSYLRSRVKDVAIKQSGPWMTLVDGLERLGRDDQARKTMEEALVALPEAGDLQISASRKFMGWGEIERAAELLEKARGSVDEISWLSEAAVQARFLGERRKAIRYRRATLALRPDHVESHSSLARLLAEEEGQEAAV